MVCMHLFAQYISYHFNFQEINTNPDTCLPAEVLDDVLKCKICKKRISKAMTLDTCLHSYCQSCLVRVEKTTQKSATGWVCPTCQAFTPEDKLRENSFIDALNLLLVDEGGDGSGVAVNDNVVTERADVVARSNDVVASSNDVVVSSNDVVASNGEVVANSNDIVANNTVVVAHNDEVVTKKDDMIADSNDVVINNEENVAISNDLAAKEDCVVANSNDAIASSDDVVNSNDAVANNDVVASNDAVVNKDDVVANSNDELDSSDGVVANKTDVVANSLDAVVNHDNVVSDNDVVPNNNGVVDNPDNDVKEVSPLTAKPSTEFKCKICTKVNATVMCVECKKELCDECKRHHQMFQIMADHEILEINHVKRGVLDKHVYCSNHPNSVVLFNCKTCDVLVCLNCVQGTHDSHVIESLNKAFLRLQNTCDGYTKKIKSNVKKLEQQIQSIEKKIEETKSCFQKARSDVEQKTNKLIDSVKAQNNEMKAKFEQVKKEALTELGRHKEAVMNDIIKMDNVTNVVTVIMEKALHDSLLHEFQMGLYSCLKELAESNEDEPAHCFKIPVPYFQPGILECDKENCLEEVKKYICEVTYSKQTVQF